MSSAQPPWVSAAFAELLELERTAARIWMNHPLFVPGPLQTEEYATAILTVVTGLGPRDPELIARVEQRMARAAAFLERLGGESAPELAVVVDEAVLHRGPAGVLRAQLRRLAEVADRHPTVRIVVPSPAHALHAGLGGGFEVYDDRVFFEAPGADRIVTDPAVVARHRGFVEAQLAAAESGEKTSELLDRIVAEL